MLKELIDKYFRKKKKLEDKGVQVIDDKQKFDISISRSKNIFTIEVSDYISIIDYVDRMKEIDQFNLLDLLGNALLWNGSKQKVNKGCYYVIMHDGYLYNLFIGEDSMGIDERVKVGENTHERIVSLKDEGDYNFTSFKHDKVGSTFYTMYYSKKGFPIPALELSRDAAYQEISEVLSNVELVPGIEDILDISKFRTDILDDLVPNGGVVSLKK